MRSSFTATPPSVAGFRSRNIPGVFALPSLDWTRVSQPDTHRLDGSPVDPGLVSSAIQWCKCKIPGVFVRFLEVEVQMSTKKNLLSDHIRELLRVGSPVPTYMYIGWAKNKTFRIWYTILTKYPVYS
jgi:hypothetical protein